MKRLLIVILVFLSGGVSLLSYCADSDEPLPKRQKTEEQQSVDAAEPLPEPKETKKQQECSICLNTNDDSSSDYNLSKKGDSCGHSFHYSCLSESFKHGNMSCPLCRADFSPAEFDDFVEPLDIEPLFQRYDSVTGTLDLSHLGLVTLKGLDQLVKQDTYPEQETIEVRTMVLDNNRIKFIRKNLFDKFPHLFDLSFAFNRELEEFEDSSVFQQLSSLESLSFANCNLKSIPSGLFDPLIQLDFLDLSENKINLFPPDCFKQLSNMKLLYMHNNPYKTLPPGLFDNLFKLQTLQLSSTLSDTEKIRITKEVEGVAPTCKIIFSNQLVNEEDDDNHEDSSISGSVLSMGSNSDDDDDQGNDEGNDSDGDLDDGDENLADISLLSYEEEPGQ